MDRPESAADFGGTLTEVVDSIVHYGVKGMRWGVRRGDKSSSGPSEVLVKTTPGKRVETAGGKRQPAHEDAIRTAGHRQKAKASTTDSLSTKDLQELVNRMNLEQQYSKLAAGSKRENAGAKFAKDLMKSETQSLLLRGKPGPVISTLDALLSSQSKAKHRKRK